MIHGETRITIRDYVFLLGFILVGYGLGIILGNAAAYTTLLTGIGFIIFPFLPNIRHRLGIYDELEFLFKYTRYLIMFGFGITLVVAGLLRAKIIKLEPNLASGILLIILGTMLIILSIVNLRDKLQEKVNFLHFFKEIRNRISRTNLQETADSPGS